VLLCESAEVSSTSRTVSPADGRALGSRNMPCYIPASLCGGRIANFITPCRGVDAQVLGKLTRLRIVYGARIARCTGNSPICNYHPRPVSGSQSVIYPDLPRSRRIVRFGRRIDRTVYSVDQNLAVLRQANSPPCYDPRQLDRPNGTQAPDASVGHGVYDRLIEGASTASSVPRS